MRINLREMTPRDVPEVVDLWAAEGQSRRLPSRKLLKCFLEVGFGQIVRVRGSLIAASVYGICGPGVGYIEHFVVAPKFRRRQVGTRLYRACAEDLFARGVRRIILLVNTSNEPAQSFWKAQNIRPIRRASALYGRLPSAWH